MLNSDDDYKRVYWHSRRGMLEIDLVLLPFVENCYRQLSEEQQRDYKALLECEDTELFAWFLQRGVPEQAHLARMVARIVDYARTRNPAG